MGISRHYNYIFRNFLSYLPSRLLVIVNALLIIPFFAHILTKKEMGMYNLCVGLLTLTCTVTSDWIAKAALRFYEKYNSQNRLEEFYSNIFIISIASYLIIGMVYFTFSDLIVQKLYISRHLLFLTLLIIFPAGFRQFLYQMLRVFNRPFLYTISIILYQASLLLLFLFIADFIPKTEALLIAMAAAIVIVDIYILKKIKLMIHMKFKWNSELLFESLRYSLPTIITNVSLWTMLNINKYIFQYKQDFISTAVTSVVAMFASATITQIVSTFSFAMFPVIVQKYEKNEQDIKDFVTKTAQLYILLFMPVIGVFLYYSDMVSRIIFAGGYNEAKYFLPFFVSALFIHELMKLVNIKYHLSNKTYIEMVITFIAGVIAFILNLCLINSNGLFGAGIAVLASFIICAIMNLSYRIKEIDNIDFFKFFRTLFAAFIIGLISAFLINCIIRYGIGDVKALFKMPFFVLLSYYFTWIARNKVLN